MFVTKTTISAIVGAASVSLFISSEIGTMLIGFAVEFIQGPMQTASVILFSLITLIFFAWYCMHAYRVEKRLQLEDQQLENSGQFEIATR